MSMNGLQELGKQGLIDANKISDLEFRENCVLGKSHGLKFAPATHKTKGTLDYIHLDLWGSPMVPTSLPKYQYFISIIDDYLRKVWIYFLKTKDEALGKFIEWKTLIENQNGKRFKRLRTDNGLEYCNKEFDDLCAKSGIARQHTCAGTPQQKGLAKRMNQVFLSRSNCNYLLFDK